MQLIEGLCIGGEEKRKKKNGSPSHVEGHENGEKWQRDLQKSPAAE